MEDKRALIFANGEQIDLEAVRLLVKPEDFLVAVDGGFYHLERLGFVPDLLIGDLDSLSPVVVESLRQNPSVRVSQHPVQKDETDLELGLLSVAREGYTSIRVLAALGGRLDMTLANIFLLALPDLAALDIRLEDGIEEVFLIRPGKEGGVIYGEPGDRVSLLPLGGPAGGIVTIGLFYPLRGESLYLDRSRGISNQMVESEARVTLESGQLICIHTRKTASAVRPDETF